MHERVKGDAMTGYGMQMGPSRVGARDESGELIQRRSKQRILTAALALLCLALLVLCASAALSATRAKGDTGTYIIPQGSMTSAEAQAMLDEQVEASRITVSIAPVMRLGNDGLLRVNFIVEKPNNGLSERLEIEQDGRVVYASGAVDPGFAIEWCQTAGAHIGPAIATVYALDGNGDDSGNPISVEVEIVAD